VLFSAAITPEQPAMAAELKQVARMFDEAVQSGTATDVAEVARLSDMAEESANSSESGENVLAEFPTEPPGGPQISYDSRDSRSLNTARSGDSSARKSTTAGAGDPSATEHWLHPSTAIALQENRFFPENPSRPSARTLRAAKAYVMFVIAL
jgi:hypothetical protein